MAQNIEEPSNSTSGVPPVAAPPAPAPVPAEVDHVLDHAPAEAVKSLRMLKQTYQSSALAGSAGAGAATLD